MPTPKRDTRLLFIVFSSLFLFLLLTYAGRLARQARLDAEIVYWEAKIEQSEAQQRKLEAELRFVRSDAYLQKLAYDEFNMVKEGEQLIAVIPVTAVHSEEENATTGTSQAIVETTVETTVEVAVESQWQQWLQWLGLR